MKSNGEQELSNYLCQKIKERKATESDDQFILTRVLKHPEMPGGDQWQISKECYICERWTYTLFLKVHEK